MTQLVPERLGARASRGWGLRERHHDAIVAGLATNTVASVWPRLRAAAPRAVSLSAFRHYVRRRIRGRGPEDVTGPTAPLAPGAVAAADDGRMGRGVDPQTGRGHREEACVRTLCASRRVFCDPWRPAPRRRGRRAPWRRWRLSVESRGG